MAIPNRTTITCPNCGVSQNVTIADSSVGPRGRVSKTPIYSFAAGDLWKTSQRDGSTWISCATCGEAEFITVSDQAKIRSTDHSRVDKTPSQGPSKDLESS